MGLSELFASGLHAIEAELFRVKFQVKKNLSAKDLIERPMVGAAAVPHLVHNADGL